MSQNEKRNESIANVSHENRKTNAVRHIRVGGVEATIWKNVSNGITTFSVSLQRSYRDRTGEWKSTYSLRQNDLPKAILALQKAYEHVALSSVS
jgi:hypothetical protein